MSSESQSTITTVEITFLQRQQQKQCQPEAMSFHREEILQLEACMLNTELTNLKA